jgi:chromosome segregation ATPase
VNPGLVGLIAVVLGGGFFTGLASLITSRANSKQLKAQSAAVDARLPAEVDSVVVTGAERAVLTMGKALDAAERRIAELEKREDEAEEVIAQLRNELADLRRQIDSCNESLRQAQARATALSERLAAIDTNNGRG